MKDTEFIEKVRETIKTPDYIKYEDPFEKKEYDIETFFKAIETLDLDFSNIYVIKVYTINDEPTYLKGNRVVYGFIPLICFNNPSKEEIIEELKPYFWKFQNLVVFFENPKKYLVFDKLGNYMRPLNTMGEF